MNVLFLSPAFPPQFFHFCTALRERGINVVGLGDTPEHELRPELRGALADYYHVPHLEDYEAVRRGVAWLVWRHGKLDRIESHTEYWLRLEATLREDFNVSGPKPSELDPKRSKTGMAEIFRRADIPVPEGELVRSAEQVHAFADQHGYPLVLKPDVGVGAAGTFKLEDQIQLDQALARNLQDYIVQPFVRGAVTSFDGLVNREGRIVYVTSHVYNRGVMEIVNQQLDLHYWSRREIPAELDELGRRAVSAFEVRERFFHLEFFELEEGGYMALEMNLRPPGGFTTDMMNYGADLDVYRLWARVLDGDPCDDFAFERKHHVAHVSRRWGRPYAHPSGEVVQRLGEALMQHGQMPRAFAGAMGDEMFLIRRPDFEQLQEDVALIQRLR
jgi:hypothetical protein